jgi:hypothetical protein
MFTLHEMFAANSMKPNKLEGHLETFLVECVGETESNFPQNTK